MLCAFDRKKKQYTTYENMLLFDILLLFIIMIKASRPCKFLRLSLPPVPPYRPSVFANPLIGTQCPPSANEHKFLLVSQHWSVHWRASIISSSLLLQ